MESGIQENELELQTSFSKLHRLETKNKKITMASSTEINESSKRAIKHLTDGEETHLFAIEYENFNFLDHRYPFSLFAEAKHFESVRRVGDVQDIMDKSIGRSVIRVTGSVSANNFVEYDDLHLRGNYVYLQLKVLTRVATVHIELETTLGNIRFSLSTLYEKDEPKFFGRSLRYTISKCLTQCFIESS